MAETETTPLDVAHAHMQSDPENEQVRMQFYARLAATELFLLLEGEVHEDQASPALFELEGQSFALAFDREDRMTGFAGGAADYVALSGRALSGMLAAEDLGLALNPDVAPSAILLPPSALSWLNEVLGEGPEELHSSLREVYPPRDLPETLLQMLDARLATAVGLAHSAYLVAVQYDSGAQGHMLGVIDPVPGAEPAIARAVSEVLGFSGLEAAALDVAFFRAEERMSGRLARVGLRFDLPQLEPEPEHVRPPPGMDPEKPPKLR